MAQPLFPNLKPFLPGRVNSPTFSLPGLKMADKKDNHGRKNVKGTEHCCQVPPGNYWASFVASFTGILFKLGRYYEIRPLSRRLIFLGRKYFYRASFEFCGLEKGHLAAVVLNVLCCEVNEVNVKLILQWENLPLQIRN
jgi:hypothetical protein